MAIDAQPTAATISTEPAAADGMRVGGGRAGNERAAYYRQRAAQALARARQQVGRPWISDPGLRVQVDAILALPPEDRIRMLESETEVLSDLQPTTP